MLVSEVQDKKVVLFVDDEPSILTGLNRSLRHMSEEWDLLFAPSGAEALQILQEKPVDLIVSDLRMPGMDGVSLLGTVKTRWPATIRFVLSGYADRFMILRCAGPSHQFLAKPCAVEEIVFAAHRAFALREMLHQHALVSFMDQTAHLPVLPGMYQTLMDALQSPNSNMKQIADIIARDAPMAAKLLHLVNSAYMVYIENIQQAASYLGAEAMSAIALTAALFEQYLVGDQGEFGIQGCYDHSISVGASAGPWVSKILKDRKLAEEATMAGMTHDIGKLVLIRSLPDAWRDADRLARERKLPMHRVEREVMGFTHADIGAALLNRWGVSDNIVEAVAYHHHPSSAFCKQKNSLFAVHQANAYCHKWHQPGSSWEQLLDLPYLRTADPAWHIDAFERTLDRA